MMATSDRSWIEERIDSLITLPDERPCLYIAKSKDYFNRDRQKKHRGIHSNKISVGRCITHAIYCMR